MSDNTKAELAIALADEMMKVRRENRFRDVGDIGAKMDDYQDYLDEARHKNARHELIAAALNFKDAEDNLDPNLLSRPKIARKRLMDACEEYTLAEQALES